MSRIRTDGVWDRRAVLPQVFAHLPEGAHAYGILVDYDARTLPVVFEDGAFQPYAHGEPATDEPDSPERWASLVASGTAWVLTDDHDDLTEGRPAGAWRMAEECAVFEGERPATDARRVWPDLARGARAR